MNLLALALLPAVALGAPPPKANKVAVLLIPMDQGAEAAAVKLESYMTDALGEFAGLNVRTADELFGVPADPEADAALKHGQATFAEGKASFEARDFAGAEKRLKLALKDLARAAASLGKGCGVLCDATAMYAASLHARGDTEEAKLVLIDLIALNPTFELDRKRYTQDFISFRAQVASSRNAQLRGNVSVKSRPAGARVFLDGELQGYTPLTLSTLQIGKHVLRLGRPGCRQYGTLVEVTPEDATVSADLSPTPAFRAYDALLDRLAAETTKEKGGPTMATVARSLGLDRGLVGTLKDVGSGRTELVIGLYDLKTGRRLSTKKAVFQGDEYGQLRSEVSRLVNHLLNHDGGEKVVKTADPLEGTHGTEEWSGEDKGGRNAAADRKKKKGDPLDGVSGTEEW